VGAPTVRAVGPTPAEALAVLKAELAHSVWRGEWLSLEIDAVSVADLAGKYADDPTLPEICAEAYEKRDAECRGSFRETVETSI
jgi:hypothetical protein